MYRKLYHMYLLTVKIRPLNKQKSVGKKLWEKNALNHPLSLEEILETVLNLRNV